MLYTLFLSAQFNNLKKSLPVTQQFHSEVETLKRENLRHGPEKNSARKYAAALSAAGKNIFTSK